MSDEILFCRLYRYRNPDGSTKDWAIGEFMGNICVFFGKTGASRLRRHNIPPEKHVATAAKEIERRIDEQLRQGYEYVGEARVRLEARGGGALLGIEEDQRLKAGSLHWELATACTSAEARRAFQTIAADLGAAPHPAVSVEASEQGLEVAVTGQKWAFGFSPSPHGHVNESSGRGGGSIPVQYGALPVLVVLAFGRLVGRRITFANDAGEHIDVKINGDLPWLAPSATMSQADVRALAIKLGLIAPSLSELKLPQPAVGFW